MRFPRPAPGSDSESWSLRPLSREAIRELDRRAIQDFAIPGIVLMENAALGCAEVLMELYAGEPIRYGPPFRIICGPGNNGGDGLALARHIHNRGFPLTLYLVKPKASLRPDSDAGINLKIADRMGLDLRETGPDYPLEDLIKEAISTGTIIDAMLGTGLDRPLRSPYLEWVKAINEAGRPVIAVDIPTGLDANTGQVLGAAIRANHTITMAALKQGFNRAAGPGCTGDVHLVGIGSPRELLKSIR